MMDVRTDIVLVKGSTCGWHTTSIASAEVMRHDTTPRMLARNAREEQLRNKPPHAFRELFRELRELMQAGPGEE